MAKEDHAANISPLPNKYEQYVTSRYVTPNGYVKIRFRHPTLGYRQMFEHRFVMAIKLSRLLRTKEHVHHKNGNRLDNRLCNLEIVGCTKHHRMHHRGRKLSPEHCEAIRRSKLGSKNPRYGKPATKGFAGRKHSKESREAISVANQGCKCPEHSIRMKKIWSGRTEEERKLQGSILTDGRKK